MSEHHRTTPFFVGTANDVHIELIGCTSAGKSTLARCLLEAFRGHGMQASIGDEFVLKQVRLNWIKSRLARILLLDLCTVLACLLFWRDNRRFCAFSIQIIARLPDGVPWAEKLNLVRNVLKRIGIYEIVRRRASSQEIVLVDEGTLHSAHLLFVHTATAACSTDLSCFAAIVPLPDMAIYVAQRESILIQRTLERGHKRIRDHSRDNVGRFIKRALEVFDTIVQQLLLDGRLQMVDTKGTTLIRQDYLIDQLFAQVPEIARAQADFQTKRTWISVLLSQSGNADALVD